MPARPKAPSRRRVLTVMAAAAALPPAPAKAGSSCVQWAGTALGADAKLIICGRDRDAARAAIASCLAELERLEKVFSLYRSGSEIRLLNAQGQLVAPSHDMRLLLALSQNISQLTEGLFDPTVQPLWEFYAQWFAAHPRSDGPPKEEVKQVLKRVGYQHLKVTPDRVELPENYRLTLNGIAQGYITDRIAGILRARGWAQVLVNMGELRAVGNKPDGTPWRVRQREGGIELPLSNEALATSAAEALTFGARRRFSHLFDPRTGGSPSQFRTLTVRHKSAAVADALSTGLCAATLRTVGRVTAAVPGLRVWARDVDGRMQTFGF
ncbi:MAG: FAD:protein FMN transferase [Alphaproteobacteria bacterium]|nr:FAD:protein FMN transferase [Alphaproteobacteria bacterium]